MMMVMVVVVVVVEVDNPWCVLGPVRRHHEPTWKNCFLVVSLVSLLPRTLLWLKKKDCVYCGCFRLFNLENKNHKESRDKKVVFEWHHMQFSRVQFAMSFLELFLVSRVVGSQTTPNWQDTLGSQCKFKVFLRTSTENFALFGLVIQWLLIYHLI